MRLPKLESGASHKNYCIGSVPYFGAVSTSIRTIVEVNKWSEK